MELRALERHMRQCARRATTTYQSVSDHMLGGHRVGHLLVAMHNGAAHDGYRRGRVAVRQHRMGTSACLRHAAVDKLGEGHLGPAFDGKHL